ncbi:hypothetical protein NSQ29_01300 [Paenibacillus sp. FSL F4-0236]|uniref:hypothetical protein n=1 Tax=Paenibacillus sp. FSL F4-0236 TaxID=2954731 RepID=UPI0030F4BEAF
MKIKKYLSVLLVAAVILIPSASAFAEETETAATEISSRAVGLGDSQATAISLVLNGAGGVVGTVIYDLFIQSATDQDWFKWTNTTSTYKSFSLTVGGYKDNGPTRAGVLISPNNGLESGILYTGKANTSETQSFYNLIVKPGTTVYVVVDAPNFTTIPSYHLNFGAYEI